MQTWPQQIVYHVSLFLLAQVKCFGDFFHDAQIKKVLIGLFEDL